MVIEKIQPQPPADENKNGHTERITAALRAVVGPGLENTAIHTLTSAKNYTFYFTREHEEIDK